jgi:hypothetical protein
LLLKLSIVTNVPAEGIRAGGQIDSPNGERHCEAQATAYESAACPRLLLLGCVINVCQPIPGFGRPTQCGVPKVMQTPIIMLGSPNPLHSHCTGSFQELDQVALFHTFVKACETPGINAPRGVQKTLSLPGQLLYRSGNKQ